MAERVFPADFLWGAATSAYQIEGSPLADGAGASIWHRFAHVPGSVASGDHGDVACDHYQRFEADVALMRELGIQAYRFSIAWPRVLPEGIGPINERGLDFYARLVDGLLDKGIRPFVTLYHWDLPATLEDRGGWAHGDAPQWFAEYSHLMFRRLGDRVPMWATINEPWVITDFGYVSGVHAPGRRNLDEAAAVARNLILAHAAAVVAYRAERKQQIGLAVNLAPIHPATHSSADAQAVRRMDAYLNRQFLDPSLLGRVPVEMDELFGAAWRSFSEDELERIRQPIDFLGINYYLRLVVRDDASAGPARAAIVPPTNDRVTATGWEVYPQGLTDTLQWVRERYGDLPLYITENGAAFDDVLCPNGGVKDLARVQYLEDHLRAAGRALRAGVDLRGYFVWSLLDNFEWQSGYSPRFGIVRVDFDTQLRTPKESSRFYERVIRSAGSNIDFCESVT